MRRRRVDRQEHSVQVVRANQAQALFHQIAESDLASMERIFGAATGVFRVALLFELSAQRAQLVEQFDNGLLGHR